MSAGRRAAARSLRIGIDTLFVRPGVNGGAEFYMRSLLAGLARVDRVNEYIVYATPRSRHLFSGLGENFRTVVCPYPGRFAEVYQRVAWEWTALRLQARIHRLDVMHFGANLVPAAFPTPTVLTIYDFSAAFYLENLPEVPVRRATRLLARQHLRGCERADVVAAISESTRGEALRRTRVPPERIHTVHLAGREFEVPSIGEAEGVVRRHGVEGPYVLSVATLSVHKNLLRLMEAFAREAEHALAGYKLVLVGKMGTAAGLLDDRIRRLGLAGRVVLPGYVHDDEIPAFYRAADVFAFPSLYEGFGLPVLEAAACGTPIVAARAASIPEIGGDAPRYVDPRDVSDIASALAEVATSPELRARMGELGLRRATQFSWERTAERMMALYAEAAAARSPAPAG